MHLEQLERAMGDDLPAQANSGGPEMSFYEPNNCSMESYWAGVFVGLLGVSELGLKMIGCSCSGSFVLEHKRQQ
jgi:hypothetical protein